MFSTWCFDNGGHKEPLPEILFLPSSQKSNGCVWKGHTLLFGPIKGFFFFTFTGQLLRESNVREKWWYMNSVCQQMHIHFPPPPVLRRKMHAVLRKPTSPNPPPNPNHMWFPSCYFFNFNIDSSEFWNYCSGAMVNYLWATQICCSLPTASVILAHSLASNKVW